MFILFMLYSVFFYLKTYVALVTYDKAPSIYKQSRIIHRYNNMIENKNNARDAHAIIESSNIFLYNNHIFSLKMHLNYENLYIRIDKYGIIVLHRFCLILTLAKSEPFLILIQRLTFELWSRCAFDYITWGPLLLKGA